MSESVEKMMDAPEEIASSENGEQLVEELCSTHALHTNGDWVRGTVENIRVRPTFQFIGTVFDRSVNINPTEYSVSNLSGRMETPAVSSEAPFVSMDSREIPYGSMYRDSIEDATVIEVESLEDLYRVSVGEYVLVPMEGLDFQHQREDGYLIGKVQFDIVGDLSSEDVIGSQPIVLSSVRSMERIDSIPFVDEVCERDQLSVKYRFTDDELSYRWLPTESQNWVSGERFSQLRFVSVVGFLFWSWIEAVGLFTSVTGWGNALVTLGAIVGFIVYAFVGGPKLNDSVRWIGEKVSAGDISRRVELLEDSAVVGESVSDAVEIYAERQRVIAKAERLKNELEKMPREVEVEPSADSTLLTAPGRDIRWNLSDGNMLSEDSVEFFIEYGFDKDMDRIETHMVQDETAVPDALPALESTNGEWYLLPEKVEVNPILTI